jgi:hypothetical protein
MERTRNAGKTCRVAEAGIGPLHPDQQLPDSAAHHPGYACWEHAIRDEGDFARHVEYIHHNPVKHGFVTNPFDWRWSSIHSFARRGIIVAEWNGRDQTGAFGD